LKKELFNIYIDRLGHETLKRILAPKIKDEELRKMNKAECINAFFSLNGRENGNIAPVLISNFGSYHQHIFLYRCEPSLKIKDLESKIAGLDFEGFQGNEIKFAASTVEKKELFILFYAPFNISYHIPQDGGELRQRDILHTPVLFRFLGNRAVFSIMTFTKGDWSKLLPKGVIDSRSHFSEDEILTSVRQFLIEHTGELPIDKLDFTDKAKEIIKMDEIDLFSATKIKKCETRHRSLIDTKRRQPRPLKVIVPEKIADILDSPIITHLEIVLIDDKFGLPKDSRLTFLPSIGSFRIGRHLLEVNINELENNLLY